MENIIELLEMKKILGKTNEVISILLKPVKKNLVFFIFIYLLGVLTIFIEVQTLHFKIPRFNYLSLILDIYLLCLLLMLVPNKYRHFFRCVISLMAYVLAIINAFCVEHFYARIGPEILNVVLETNPRESSEFIDKYIGLDVLCSSVGVILLLMMLHFTLYKYISKCFDSFKGVNPLNSVAAIKWCFSLFLILSFVCCSFSAIYLSAPQISNSRPNTFCS